MATLALAVVAGAIIGELGLVAGSIAALAISAAATTVGAVIDSMLFGALTAKNTKQSVSGPRLDEVRFQQSTEGISIPRVIGRMRLSGNIIWTTRFREEVITTTTKQGGKSLGGGGSATTTTTEYKYYVSFAVGLCEGEIAGIGRIWADNQLLPIEADYRVYLGTEDQEPDPKIVAVEGIENAPAYRGTAYVVFEEMPLEDFGRRIPSLNFEVYRFTENSQDEYEGQIESIVVGPGTGEFTYSVQDVGDNTDDTSGESVSLNTHGQIGVTDFENATQQLYGLLPNLSHTSMRVSWFGDDLRCDSCTIKPMAETATRSTTPITWTVSGAVRETAAIIATDDNNDRYFDGTPSDLSIYEAIQAFLEKSISVTFIPDVRMHILPENALVNPHTGESPQPAFPFRDRITLPLAPNVDGSSDGTSAATAEVAAFFGTCDAADFGEWDGTTIPYTGPAEWSYRRMVLHYAKLFAAAGAQGTILIGSELKGLTSIRDDVGYPVITQLKALAAEVKTIVGSSIKVSYCAAWDEWHSHHIDEDNVNFHMDALWADANIDYVGLNYAAPLSDWRDVTGHLDSADYSSIYDPTYLKGNIEGGEYFDWLYATEADREEQVRTDIVDPHGLDEPWVYRLKDIRNWWSNQHISRVAGAHASASAWVPESKPFVFYQLSCPPVNKGSNQPYLPDDLRNEELVRPFFSNGSRDDQMQRAYYQAVLTYWKISSGNNVMSQVDGRYMVRKSLISPTQWDVRPYPVFPHSSTLWADDDNWYLGKWLTGRLGQATLSLAVEEICSAFNVPIDTSELHGLIKGYSITDTSSPRDVISPLSLIYYFDAYESDGMIKFRVRGQAPNIIMNAEELIWDDGNEDNSSASYFTLTKNGKMEVPTEVRLRYVLDNDDLRTSVAKARRTIHSNRAVSESSVNVLLASDEAYAITDVLLNALWINRDSAEFRLPPNKLAADPTDVIRITLNDRSFDFRIVDIGFEGTRPVKAIRTHESTYKSIPGPRRVAQSAIVTVFGAPVLVFMDLPLIKGDEVPHAPFAAASAIPWPGAINMYRASGDDTFILNTTLTAPTAMGVTLNSVAQGPTSRWDYGNYIDVEIGSFAQLQSQGDNAVFAGGNIGALLNPSTGDWEVFQWANATLIGVNRYRLSKLLRGQLGTEYAMGNPLPEGSRFVVVDTSIRQLDLSLNFFRLPLDWSYGPATDAIGDPSYKTTTYTAQGAGMRPYSPVHLKGTLSGNDIVFDWIRRTRIGGDVWDGGDVALQESVERYQILIYNGGNVVRQTEVDQVTSWTYTAAMQTADFGSTQTSVDISVAQVSNTYGPGIPIRATVNV